MPWLRLATAADAEALAELGARAFVAKFGHLYSADNLARFLTGSHSRDKVAAEIADPAMCVTLAVAGDNRNEGDDEGGLLGFCKLVLACGWPEYARGGRTIELKQLYTDPARVGGGIGGALMDRALADARSWGADEMQISVWSGNPGAQRFYARYGFDKVADIDFWVGDHRDEEFLYAARL